MKLSLTTAAVIAALICAGAAQARAPKPTKYLTAQVNTVRGLLKIKTEKASAQAQEVDAKLKAVIDPVMEFGKLSERALGKHWPTLTEEQRKTFVDTFRELVYRSYLRRVRSADEQYSIAYEDEEAKGQKAVVTAIAKTKKAEIELVFHLAERDKTRWVAEDIVIDEVSLVENYREQFNKIITDKGFDELISKMKKKLAELG